MSRYRLPNRNHVVVDDIAQIADTCTSIDSDITILEDSIAVRNSQVTNLLSKTVRSNVSDGVIYDIAPNRFITVNASGTGFTTIEGGGTKGGSTTQCCVKASDEDFEAVYANIWEISKGGQRTQSNIEESTPGQFVIICDESEIENDKQAPQAAPTVLNSIHDVESCSNESICFSDSIEPVQSATREFATTHNYGEVKTGTGINVDSGVISVDTVKKACRTRFGIVKPGTGVNIEDGVISVTEAPIATNQVFGLIKIGEHFEINNNGEMEVFKEDMADASIIYYHR